MTSIRLMRSALAFALAGVMTGGAGGARAQHIVHDPTAYARLVEQARTTVRQLEALQAQLEQGEALFDSLNSASGVNALAAELGLPQVRAPLPDAEALRRAGEGDLGALGDLAARAAALREAHRLHSPPADAATRAEAWYNESLERAGARTARDLAVSEAAGAAADRRMEGLETLRSALDAAPNARAVLDLQARLAAEQALIGNEQVRLQGAAIARAAEDRLEVQRQRERAEAARAARMTLYESRFR